MQQFGKQFVKAQGDGPIVGKSGPLWTYSFYIQKGLPEVLHISGIAHIIQSTLGDERGWTRTGGVRFQRVEKDAGTTCVLAKPDQVDQFCYPLQTEGEVSCCNGRYVIFNIRRWRHGVPHWSGPIRTYRQMVINHEFGHRIGMSHGYCPNSGNKAPVMQQQTYGLQGCAENSWPLDSEVAKL